jgi:hypothetical protein
LKICNKWNQFYKLQIVFNLIYFFRFILLNPLCTPGPRLVTWSILVGLLDFKKMRQIYMARHCTMVHTWIPCPCAHRCSHQGFKSFQVPPLGPSKHRSDVIKLGSNYKQIFESYLKTIWKVFEQWNYWNFITKIIQKVFKSASKAARLQTSSCSLVTNRVFNYT